MPLDVFKLRPEVRWRAYDDGVVVYVGETCETHIVAADFHGLLSAPQHAVIVDEPGVLATLPDTGDGVTAVQVSRALVNELVELKIFDRLTS
jgi:hypothetical protein